MIKVTLGDMWASEEEFALMTDDYIIEMMYEDLMAALEDAEFTVIR